jgi:hypothetical protein
MASTTWEKRLCNLIKKYKPSSDTASFRNEYRDVVAQVSAENRTKKGDAGLLLEAREFLEAWASSPPPDPSAAYQQWRRLYEAGSTSLPGSVLECFLRRFPQTPPGALDWEPFLLSCLDGSLVEVLLDRRLVSEEDMNRLAQSKPVEFYQSVALDVMVERRALRNPRPLWDECVRGTTRHSGLLLREEVLVHLYIICPGEVENEMLLSFLLNSPSDRDKALQLLLDHREGAARFCRYLTFATPVLGMRSRDWVASMIQNLLVTWVAQCEVEMKKRSGSRTQTAALILGIIRVSVLVKAGQGIEQTSMNLGEEIGRTLTTVTSHVLRQMEENRSSSDAETVLVVLGKEVHGAVQEYLRKLPTGANTGQESPERAFRFERFKGSKEVIDQVLLAMEEPLEDKGLRDALEVALFNCGVRPLGTVGERVSFDPHVHEAETAGVVPDEPAIVTHPGRYLGDRKDGLVLAKAKIRPSSH